MGALLQAGTERANRTLAQSPCPVIGCALECVHFAGVAESADASDLKFPATYLRQATENAGNLGKTRGFRRFLFSDCLPRKGTKRHDKAGGFTAYCLPNEFSCVDVFCSG